MDKLLQKLQACIGDPMWPDHAEISKATLREVVALLAPPDAARAPTADPEKLPIFAWAHCARPEIIHHRVKDLWLKVSAQQVENYIEPLVLLKDVRSMLRRDAARVVPEIPPDWSQYPKSSEGTIRCTCGDYPHAKWCGNIPTQKAWEQGYQFGQSYSTERVGQKPEAPFESAALRDVRSERERQQSVEGWTPEHDDEHVEGELALAAACYAMGQAPMSIWPRQWDVNWWKPGDRRRSLVKAGALILAEIERLDRKGRVAPGNDKPDVCGQSGAEPVQPRSAYD